MRILRSNAKKLGAAIAVASLAIAVPVTTSGTAHANPDSSRVVVTGTASCAQFEDSTLVEVSITPTGKAPKTDQFSAEDVSDTYTVVFTKIPKLPRSQPANATVICVDSGNTQHTFSKPFNITRPAGGTEVQSLDLK
ncbi:hypothetical protein [Streptomyces sp. NPDC057690]|uniref:hypothetical protein n=1 Tax=Streptomyces sp. NPDC057690 TaxID=3346214 RepID=UPI00368F34E3